MENNQSFNELEQMRQQMEEFKAQLHNQKIVNEKLIISSMKKGMSWIKKFVIFEIFLVPIVLFIWLGIKEFAGLSWYNYGFLAVFMIVDVIIDYRINVSAMSDADYSRNNLLITMKKLMRMKRQRYIFMIVELPLMLIWFVWGYIEACMNFQLEGASDYGKGLYYGGLVGGIIGLGLGLAFGFYIYFKMQRINDDMIGQINEIKNME